MDKANQSKLLMDYTIFHIGLYTTLSTVLIALLGLKGFTADVLAMRPYLLATLFCFIVAGFCGGMIASSLPHFSSFKEFSKQRLGPWFLPRLMPMLCWTYAEHTAFWIGIVVAVLGLLRTGPI